MDTGAVRIPALAAAVAAIVVLLAAGAVPASAVPSATAVPSVVRGAPVLDRPAADSKKPKPVDPDPYTTTVGRLTHLDFDTADHNLHCGIWDTGDSNSYYGCTITHRTYREPRDTHHCRQYYGHGFVARFGTAPRVACRGDVLFDGETHHVTVLKSGRELVYGAIACHVSGRAVTCGNQRGDGFTLSARKYTLRKG